MKFVQDVWKKEPVWTLIVGFGLLMGGLFIIGPGGQQTILNTIHGVGSDPVASMQALGAGMALALGALAGLLHFFPFTKKLGGDMLRGIGLGLVILFVVVPLGGWAIQHHSDLGNAFASLQHSPAPRR